MTSSRFAVDLQRFFHSLHADHGFSAHTVAAYRDTFRLLLRFLRDQRRVAIDRVDFKDLTAEVALAFLTHLEGNRSNAIRTRNARLSAIKSFVRFALADADPRFVLEAQRILSIPMKRTSRRVLGFMSRAEIDSILSATDLGTHAGRRDHLLFALLYNTGSRISEALQMRAHDVQNRIVHLHGKGRKERDVPIWPQTQQEIAIWCKDNDLHNDQFIFADRHGAPLSRRAAAMRLSHAVRLAAKECSSLRGRKITLHTFRHSTAAHLLQAGVPLEIISLWLGHEQPITTHAYIEADMKMKRACLDRLKPTPPTRHPRRQSSHLLDFLEAL